MLEDTSKASTKLPPKLPSLGKQLHQPIAPQLFPPVPVQRPEWQVKAGRHLGTKYQGDSRGCQDYAIAKANEKGAWAIACDGAGSSKHSQIASETIAEAISLYFESGNIFTDGTKTSVFKQNEILKSELKEILQNTLQALCQKHKKPLQDFHTTLLFVYHYFAKEQYYLGHIGDGMIVGVTEDGLEILSHSQTGEGASNQTYFVSHLFSKGGEQYFRTTIAPARSSKFQDYIGYMCFSDGVEDYVHLRRTMIVKEYKKDLHPDLLAFFNNLAKVENLGAMLNERWIKTGHTDDDCCLAIIKDANKSCALDFRQEHEFYANALKKQQQADKEYRLAQQRKQQEERKRREDERKWQEQIRKKEEEEIKRRQKKDLEQQQQIQKQQQTEKYRQPQRQIQPQQTELKQPENGYGNRLGSQPDRSPQGQNTNQQQLSSPSTRPDSGQTSSTPPRNKPTEYHSHPTKERGLLLKLKTTRLGLKFTLTIDENLSIKVAIEDSWKIKYFGHSKNIPLEGSTILELGKKKDNMERVSSLDDFRQEIPDRFFISWKEANEVKTEKFIFVDKKWKSFT